jgi:hypothetical protein
MAADRLSDLPDDLLVNILSFAPIRDAARCTSLSRRWRRPLWLLADTVNFDMRSSSLQIDLEWLKRWAFFRDAFAARGGRGNAPVKALSLRCTVSRDRYLRRQDVERILAFPAVHGIGELRVEWEVPNTGSPPRGGGACRCDGIGASYIASWAWPEYDLRPDALPCCRTLQVLDLTGVLLGRSRRLAGDTFERLTTLRLRRCALSLSDLQAIARAAPRLASLRLEGSEILKHTAHVSLRCPTVGELELACCDLVRDDIELDAPRLRAFRYKGLMRRFSFTSSTPCPERVCLDFCGNRWIDTARGFCHARVLNLRVSSIEDVAVVGNKNLQPIVFPNLERLTLRGSSKQGNEAWTATAIAILLRRCPLIRQLRLELIMRDQQSEDGGESMDRIRNCLLHNVASEIPGVQVSSFTCSQSHLREVKFLFQLPNANLSIE